MTLRLSPRDLDRTSSTPLWQQLANRIREAIDSDELRPGDSLPSEPEAEQTLGISRPVVRQAWADLIRDGLIVKQRGSTPRVAEPPHERRMDTGRYLEELAILDAGGEHPRTSGFAKEHDVDFDRVAIDAEYRPEKATADDANLLGIPEGAPIMRRSLVKFIDDEPLQIQRSAVPLDIAEGTVLADPDAQPYPGGTIAELYAAGHRVTRVSEKARARPPEEEERRQLQLASPGPVLDIVRTFYAGDRAVEASRVVRPAASTILVYETDLTGE